MSSCGCATSSAWFCDFVNTKGHQVVGSFVGATFAALQEENILHHNESFGPSSEVSSSSDASIAFGAGSAFGAGRASGERPICPKNSSEQALLVGVASTPDISMLYLDLDRWMQCDDEVSLSLTWTRETNVECECI
jgi:hypothetical protein